VFIYFYFFATKATITVAPGGAGLPVAGQGTTPTTDVNTTLPGEPTPVTARLVKVSVGPVVLGESVINIRVASSSPPEAAVSYIERQSGNVFSYSPSAGTITRTSNQTVPGIQSAAWLPNGATALVRYLSGDDFSTINTYALPATSGSTEGYFLPQNLADIDVSSTSVLTLASGVNGSVASLGGVSNTRTTQIFTTPLSELHVSFAGKSHYLAYTKPSAALPGAAFIVDAAGTFSRISGPQSGLVALASHSGKWLLVSYTENNLFQMELVNTATGDITSLPVATIADKCVWTADDSAIYCGIPVDPSTEYSYPDDWYQGAVSFSDRIWKIDVAGRYAQLVLDFPTETDSSLDATALAIDPLNTTLVFVNKNDSSLWSYQL
jgi:hypothetical protein